MGPELEELKSSSAGTSLETPGQQCSPNEGTWDQGRTTASGFLTAGVGSSLEGKQIVTHGTSQKHENYGRRHLPAAGPQTQKRREQAVRPWWKRREGPALERGCNSTFFFWGELGGSLLVLHLSELCVCSVFYVIFFPS